MSLPAVIVFPEGPAASLTVGGLHPANRQIIDLYHLGVRAFYLVGDLQAVAPDTFVRVPGEARIHAASCPDTRHLARCIQSIPDLSGDMLWVRGDCIIDPRLLAEVLNRKMPHWIRTPHTADGTLPAAARLTPEMLEAWNRHTPGFWMHGGAELRPESVDDYSPSHRGNVPVYVMPAGTPEAAAAASRTLIRSAQKKVLDLPARILDPLFENRLVLALCPTRISPNQVTLFTMALGLIISLLFLKGYLRLGSLLAYAVEVLDGVDGKLARTKLQFSRLGEMEHVFDFFMEQAWYLCITWYLFSSTGNGTILWIGAGFMACDLADRLLYYLVHVRAGKELDELGRFERAFRLIGGRRNIYMWIFLFGFWGGSPLGALAVNLVWAMVTVAVHGTCVAYRLSRPKPHRA